MAGFEGNQSIEPPYDSYSDPDAYSACDQVVDFSKRYVTEKDVQDLPMEEPQTPEDSAVPKPSLDVNNHDEVKFFYTEGTPVIESNASSCWDLRECVGVEQSSTALIAEEQTRMEHCFSSPRDFPLSTRGTENCINSNLVVGEIHTFEHAEERESNKEDECINQEPGVSFTRLSSPLMFSRSSSVGSLNSFEQHSIVDDRSSVSAFSTLPSGLISPSEIPDSPFELASPSVCKNKNNEFTFPSNDKSEDPVLVDQNNSNEEFQDETFGDSEGSDCPNVYEYDECLSISDLSALSIQEDSALVSISVILDKNTLVDLTQKSSITEGTADFVDRCENLDIPDQSEVLRQNCISTMPSHPLDLNLSEKTQRVIETTYEDKGTSTSEDFNFCDDYHEHGLSSFTNVKTSTPIKKKQNKGMEFSPVENFKENTFVQQYKDPLQSSDCSKDNSDDESDDLLAKCILDGKPSKDNGSFNDSKQSLNGSFRETSGSSMKESFNAPNCSFSQSDDSDDECEELINDCVLLGRQQKSNSMQIKNGKSRVFEMSSDNNVTAKEIPERDSPNHQLRLLDEILLKEKQIKQESFKENLSLVAPESVSNQRNFAQEEEFSSYNLISQSEDQGEINNDLSKSDDDEEEEEEEDSDNDESNLLVLQVIQLGMPKNQSRSPPKQKETKLPVTYPPNEDLGSRDNCPDGVSDGEDEDDDMVMAVIKAGKPNSTSETNKSVHAQPAPCQHSQNMRRLTAAEDRQLYLNNYRNIISRAYAPENYVNEGEYDPSVFMTEGTPIQLSPTPSIGDLSILSFPEDKSCQESFLNNSRNSDNSDSSSESEDDELVIQCIQKGMPGARSVAV